MESPALGLVELIVAEYDKISSKLDPISGSEDEQDKNLNHTERDSSSPNSNSEDDCNVANTNESDDSNSNHTLNASRRIFTPKFKQSVVDAFGNDPECSGNQRATARKFGIHRRQVQKWLKHIDEDGPFIEDTSEIFASGESGLKTPNQSCASAGSRKEILSAVSSRDSDIDKEPLLLLTEKEECLKDDKVEGNVSCSDLPQQRNVLTSEVEEAYDLSKMSSSSMALSLNLSMNSNPISSTADHGGSNLTFNPNATSRSMMSQYGTNNNSGSSPYLNSNSLLRLFPNTSPLLNYDFSTTTSNGVTTNKSTDRHRTESPANLSTTSTSGGEASNNTTPNHPLILQNNHISTNPLDIVDEISYLYPHEDYNLLRQALIRNEVSLTKVRKLSSSPILEPVAAPNINNSSNHANIPLNSNTRGSSSPFASSTLPSASALSAHQTLSSLDILRHQTEYLKLLQQSGLALPFPPTGINDSNSGYGSTSDSPSKYPSWFHSLATATALRLTANPSASGATKTSSRRKTTPTFATPKLPTSSPSVSSNSSKPKTVAAALAASRLSPNQNNGSSLPDYPYETSRSKNKSSQRKRQPRNKTTTERSFSGGDDDYIDPTSMLEVVTTSTPPEYSTNNLYGKDPLASTTNPLHFLNQLLLQSPSSNNKTRFPDITLPKYENQTKTKAVLDSNAHSETAKVTNSDLPTSETTKNMVLHAFVHDNEVSGDARALARKFGLNVRVVMKWIKENSPRHMPPATSAMNGGGKHNLNSSDNCFTPPPAVLKPPRINGTGNGPTAIGNLDLTMMKLMNNLDTTSALNNYFSNVNPVNGESSLKNNEASTLNNNGTGAYHHLPNYSNANSSANHKSKTNTINSTSVSTNKRKNSKPNQICDFLQDEFFSSDEPVDMIVSNKKRRYSSAQQDI